jgi:hypothetical protein
VLVGWRKTSAEEAEASAQSDESALLRKLVDLSLITMDQKAGKPLHEVEYQLPAEQLYRPAHSIPRCPEVIERVGINLSVLRVRISLSNRPMSEIVKRVADARSATGVRVKHDKHDAELLKRHLDAFTRERDNIVVRNKCLRTSLELTDYLSRRGFFPRIVFGVKADPFHAHCWVDLSGTLLNDEIDIIGRFKPILIV